MAANQNRTSLQRMRELIDLLGTADIAYYRDDNPSMTDREYDAYTEELQRLESQTGLILSGPQLRGVRRNSGRTSIRSAYKAHAVCK